MSNVKKVTSNMIWRFLERCGAQGISFLVIIIIARVVEPEVYGTVALVTVFVAILNVFIDSGFGVALIQKKDADDLDFSTVFYFNLISSFVLYAAMFFAAPLIAKFYKTESLTSVVRVLSLQLLISGIKNVQISYVSKKLQFKKFFFATLSGTIISAVVSIIMAYRGFGVWALVVQTVLNHVIDTCILWIIVDWHPKMMFSFKRLLALFDYGWKLFVSAIIDTTYTKLRQLIIGRMYSHEDLAFYNKGDNFPHFLVNNINASIDSVLLPTMSNAQDDVEKVKLMTRRAIKTSTYVLMPMMMGLAVCAEPIVRLLLTEKWLPCVFFMRIFCFAYAFHPINTANLNAIKALGRSDLFLKLEIIKKTVGMTVLLSTMWFGVKVMAYSVFFTSIIAQIINSWPNARLLCYNYIEQLKDMLPQIGLSFLMGAIVYSVSFIQLSDLLILLMQIPVGVVVYVVGSKLFRIDSFDYVLNIIREYTRKSK